VRRPVSTPSRFESSQSTVFGRIVREAILPHPPDHPHPGAPEHAYGVRVIAAAGSRPPVDVPGPGVTMACGVGHGGYCLSEALVAGPSEGRHLTFAGFDRHRTHALVKGGQGLAVGVALATVANDLSASKRAAVTVALGSLKSERKTSPSGWTRTAWAIWELRSPICSTIGGKAATNAKTTVRRASTSTSPARPRGAERSRSSSSLASLRPQQYRWRARKAARRRFSPRRRASWGLG
jgi:hypothetical protein